MRKVVMFGVLAAAVTMASGASAATASADMNGMAERGHLYISAERMFGVSWTKYSTERTETVGGASVTTTSSSSNTTIGLLWNNNTSSTGVPSVYLVPRVGVDFTVIDGLTVGGSIGYFHTSGSYDSERKSGSVTQTTSGDTATVSGFLFAPRVGYILPLGGSIGLWLRGGLSYYSVSAKDPPATNGDEETNSLSGLSLNLDPQFVVTPVEHFFFTAGLSADVPLTGNYENKQTNGGATVTTSYDAKFTHVGLTMGVGGYL